MSSKSSSSKEMQLASAAAGFTLGFGILTVWKAFQQTKANKSPLRSTYIFMLWGEIVANIALGSCGWLLLHNIVAITPFLLFFILFFYVFEVQLLLQIIINRVAIFTERKSTATRLKWCTAILITAINIMVFCIWIPSHMDPPPNQTFVNINKYWDRTSKVLILLVDAGLNWYFIHVVSFRLVKTHGLKKYRSLVSYYSRLGIVSVAMDVMLIGLMSLPNDIVYIQFHPIAYMVKLHIEMSMADLIVRIARNSEIDVYSRSTGAARSPEANVPNKCNTIASRSACQDGGIHDYTSAQTSNFQTIAHGPAATVEDGILRNETKGITRQTEVQVYVHDSDNESGRTSGPKRTTTSTTTTTRKREYRHQPHRPTPPLPPPSPKSFDSGADIGDGRGRKQSESSQEGSYDGDDDDDEEEEKDQEDNVEVDGKRHQRHRRQSSDGSQIPLKEMKARIVVLS